MGAERVPQPTDEGKGLHGIRAGLHQQEFHVPWRRVGSDGRLGEDDVSEGSADKDDAYQSIGRSRSWDRREHGRTFRGDVHSPG
jgi:hypothetical protein